MVNLLQYIPINKVAKTFFPIITTNPSTGVELLNRAYRLSKGEYELVKKLASLGVSRGYVEEISQRYNIDITALNSLLPLLQGKNLVKIKEYKKEIYRLTERGREVLKKGLPEEKLLKLLIKNRGEIPISLVKESLGSEAGIAIGQLKRKGYVELKEGTIRLKKDPNKIINEIDNIKELLAKANQQGITNPPKELVKRGFLVKHTVKKTYFEFLIPPQEIISKSKIEIAKLSHEIISTGLWRKTLLKEYDVKAEPPEVYPARKHFLGEFIEMLRDMMKELGFIEVRGPLVDVELFNFDLLFQAQDHPAREIHDTLRIREPKTTSIEAYADLIKRVAKVHEKGWGYRWDPNIAARLLLRSQTTAVSARVLAQQPEPPIKYFTVGRVFRSDVVDATHLPEFHQLDGIMGWEGYTFKDLIGLLKEVAQRLGLQLKLKPGYFPFTEPSVEGYVRLPNGKWLELFGAGLFRPEVLEAAGVDYPVGAWGFGVERLAAAYYGITDIRELYTKDVEFLKKFPVYLVKG